MLVTALLIVVLSSGGCGEKTENIGRLIADAKQERDKGNNSAAIIHLKNLLQKFPEHAEAHYLLGVIYNDTGYFTSAEKELRRALELQYEQAKVIPPLGKSLLMTGQFQKVLDQVRLEGDAGNQAQAEVLTLRALASIGLGRSREGRELLEQALPGSLNRGCAARTGPACGEREEVDEAARLIERALASAPKVPTHGS